MRLIAVVLLVALPLAGCLREYEDPHALRIVTVDLRSADVLSQDVLLNVTTTLDNRGGGKSGDLRVQAKAYSEDTGFLVAENETMVGTLSGDTTRAVSLSVLIPRQGNARIDVALFEDGQGTERASVSARNLGALEPAVLDTGLRVRDMDFLVRNVSTEGNRTRAQIQSDLYVTNEGSAPSEDLRIQVKAREISTGLIGDIAWVDSGSVPTGSTVLRSTNLTVADGYNYAIEALTWRGDVVVARNEGTVQLAPTFTQPKDQELVTTNPNVNDFLTGTPSSPTYSGDYGGGYPEGAVASPRVPGFGALAGLAAAALAAVVLARRRRA